MIEIFGFVNVTCIMSVRSRCNELRGAGGTQRTFRCVYGIFVLRILLVTDFDAVKICNIQNP